MNSLPKGETSRELISVPTPVFPSLLNLTFNAFHGLSMYSFSLHRGLNHLLSLAHQQFIPPYSTALNNLHPLVEFISSSIHLLSHSAYPWSSYLPSLWCYEHNFLWYSVTLQPCNMSRPSSFFLSYYVCYFLLSCYFS